MGTLQTASVWATEVGQDGHVDAEPYRRAEAALARLRRLVRLWEPVCEGELA